MLSVTGRQWPKIFADSQPPQGADSPGVEKKGPGLLQGGQVRKQEHTTAIGGWLLALLLPAMAVAADAPQAAPSKTVSANLPDEELDEVLVNGVRIKATRDPQKIVNWLKLLVGQFRYEGYVQPRREGALGSLLRVQGGAD